MRFEGLAAYGNHGSRSMLHTQAIELGNGTNASQLVVRLQPQLFVPLIYAKWCA
jgi:hypothetical protein